MRRLAKKITVDLNDNSFSIEGEPFPYCLSADGIDVESLGSNTEIARVNVSIFASTVEVIPKVEEAEEAA